MTKQRKQPVAAWTVGRMGAELARQLALIAERARPYRQELAGVIMLALSGLVILNLLGLTAGIVPAALGNLARSLFGWGAIPIVGVVGLLGAQFTARFFKEDASPLSMEVIIGLELALTAGLAVVHLLAGGDDPLALAKASAGGGFVGWGLGTLAAGLVGRWAAAVLFTVIGLAGLGLTLRLERAEPALFPPPVDPPPLPPIPSAPKTAPKPAPKPPPKPAISAEQALEDAVTARRRRGYRLPPLDLLAPVATAPGQKADARYQAQIIEETLTGFGVPAEVVEINRGPTVTQFGVKPGTITKRLADGTVLEQRVRVSKINSLINDLALALAAAPIRIETPVPGRPIVGIEVPNSNIALVSLRGALETAAFRRATGALNVALGKGAGGDVAVANLMTQPHLLIAGATGSGKSVCINAIIISLLMNHTPDTLKLLMIDPKMVELAAFNGIPHLIAPVVTDFDQVAGALAWVTREMERRYKAFADAGARNIGGYNKKVKRQEQLPLMVIIIDELADLMMLAADDVERYICRIAQMARATGIHMIIATQRPSTDVVTGLIKANFPARIAFAVSSQIDSRVILDTPGAEKLLGKGDMLYMAPDSPKLARLQGCFVSDAEIKNVVRYWQRTVADDAPGEKTGSGEEADPAPAPLPWAGILKEAAKDDLLAEAIEVVVESGRASTSFLQRKLGIGYPRASRLIDQLEEEGVISPAGDGNVRAVLWPADEDDA